MTTPLPLRRVHQEVVLTAESRRNIGFVSALIRLWRSAFQFRDLILSLHKRDFLMNYRRSVLGYGWLFISPLLGVFSWIFMNFTGVLAPGDIKVSYPVFVIINTCMWGFFVSCYNQAAETLKSGSSLLFQVNFPHEVLFLKQLLQSLSNFAISLFINVLLIIAFGVIPSWKIIFLPIILLPTLLLGSAIGLLVSLISAVTPDVRRIADLLIAQTIFITPILYSKQPSSHVLQQIIRWNPLTPLMGMAQDMVFDQSLSSNRAFLMVSAGTVLLFIFSVKVFIAFEDKFIEKMV